MSRSESLLRRAQHVIPGGVNSPVRAFNAVEGNPPFIQSATSCWMNDVDGNQLLDLIGSWGPMILGHAHPEVIKAIQTTATMGTSFGAPTEGEVLFAEEICAAHPCLDMVRLCSSGTEATMHAIRLARGHTGKDYLIKIDGCYHGAHDAMLVKAGSGVATFAEPGSPGIPEAVAALTLTAPFNDVEIIEQHLRRHAVAAIILEAVPGNMGCIVPHNGYFERLRSLCDDYGALLIVDEVMTGFRLARGGACERFNIEADLVALGKVIGGGLPLAAFGGKQDVMTKLSPLGPVYQAGTLSGNPLAVAAGRATLKLLNNELYLRLEKISEEIERRIAPVVKEYGCSFTRVGSMFTVFFRETPPENFSEVLECDFDAFGSFHRNALNEGIYFPPSQYEAVFLGIEMGPKEIDWLERGVKNALKATFAS